MVNIFSLFMGMMGGGQGGQGGPEEIVESANQGLGSLEDRLQNLQRISNIELWERLTEASKSLNNLGKTMGTKKTRKAIKTAQKMFKAMSNTEGAMKLITEFMNFIFGAGFMLKPFIPILKLLGTIIKSFLTPTVIALTKALTPLYRMLAKMVGPARKAGTWGEHWYTGPAITGGTDWVDWFFMRGGSTDINDPESGWYQGPIASVSKPFNLLGDDTKELSLSFGGLNNNTISLNKSFGGLNNNTISLKGSFGGLDNKTDSLKGSFGSLNKKSKSLTSTFDDLKKKINSIKIGFGGGGGGRGNGGGGGGGLSLPRIPGLQTQGVINRPGGIYRIGEYEPEAVLSVKELYLKFDMQYYALRDVESGIKGLRRDLMNQHRRAYR